MNTISSSFGSLTSKVDEFHRYILDRSPPEGYRVSAMPTNNALNGIVEAIAKAVSQYRKSQKKYSSLFPPSWHPHLLMMSSPNSDDAVAVMIVQQGETNVGDQRWIEFELWRQFKIHMLRRTIDDMATRGQYDAKTGDLTM